MINSKLTFLDTSVVLNNNKILLEMFRKPSDCVVNYHSSVIRTKFVELKNVTIQRQQVYTRYRHKYFLEK